MHEYKITLEIFKETLLEILDKEPIANFFGQISPQIRAALTRQYNDIHNYDKKNKTKKKKKSSEDPENKYTFDEEGNIIEEHVEAVQESEGEGQDENSLKEVEGEILTNDKKQSKGNVKTKAKKIKTKKK